MTIIIGIDPGSRLTGYGIIQNEGNHNRYLASGCLRLTGEELSQRLTQIFSGIQEKVLQYQPLEAAIEQVFMHKNANSAIKLGQARGAAIVALGLSMPLTEYSARQVKLSVVGFGAAQKNQVQHMVRKLLNLEQKLQADEADALAIALCHAHARFCAKQFSIPLQKKKNSWRDFRV